MLLRTGAARRTLLAVALGAVAAGAVLVSAGSAELGRAAGSEGVYPFSGPVPRAHCGAGGRPEPAAQGEVTVADRQSGRSQLGYWCNLQLVGQYQGVGAGWQNTWYDHCDYYDTAQNTTAPGVQVVDVSDPTRPKATTTLTSPAMLGPWESLKVNDKRRLLGAVAAYDGAGQGPLFFDVYDVSKDCANPTRLATLPVDIPFGHEGNWAADGMTYYGSSLYASTIAAIDVSNPSLPTLISVIHLQTHGLATNPSGTRLYLATTSGNAGSGNGLDIVDVSGIQSRTPGFTPTVIGHVYWADGSTAQHPIYVTYAGRPYIVFTDEGGGSDYGSGTSGAPGGAARIIDISDERNPRIVSSLRVEIQTDRYGPQNQAEIAGNGLFGYQGHYCAVDREDDPTALACGYFQSGIRVFDIRNPIRPREIAYFNPPAQVAKHGQIPGSEHAGQIEGEANNANLTADWCSSQVRFYTAPDGQNYLWAQCQDNGFMVLKFTNGAYPLSPLSAPTTTTAVAGAGVIGQAPASSVAYGLPAGPPATAAGEPPAAQPPAGAAPGAKPAPRQARPALAVSSAAYHTAPWLPLAVILLWLLLLLNLGVGARRIRN